MSKAYWIIVKEFDVALKDNQLLMGSEQELGFVGRNKIQMGEYQGFIYYKLKRKIIIVNLRFYVAKLPAQKLKQIYYIVRFR